MHTKATENMMNVTKWKVRPKCGGAWLVVDTLAELEEMLAHEGPGFEDYDLRRVEMTEAEVAAIGEFDGW